MTNILTKHVLDLNENLPTSARLRFLLESMDEESNVPTDQARSTDILKLIRQRNNRRDDQSQD